MPAVTRAQALEAYRVLSEIIRQGQLPQVNTGELNVPATIFRSSLSPFSAIATYLHTQGITSKRIAKILRRNKNFVEKSITQTTLDVSGVPIPVQAFSGELSILESAAEFLQNSGLDNKAIASEIGKTPSMVWMLLERARAKRGGEQ